MHILSWIGSFFLRLLIVAFATCAFVAATIAPVGFDENSPESISIIDQVKKVISNPIIIKAEDDVFKISPLKVNLRFIPTERFYTFNYSKLENELALIAKKVDRPAVDASLDIDSMDVIPQKDGREVDLPKTLAVLAGKLYDGKLDETFETALRVVKPNITTAEIQAYDPEPLGKFTTNFNRWQTNRVSNIRLAVAQLNNYMLKPGAVFSFNEIVGERTPERGYKEAGIIKEGKFDTGIGGGICQVSSTIFNAACWQAHLPVVERHRHAVSVKYVRPGHDATVNWGSYDFKFKNPYEDKTLVIKAKVEGSSVSIAIYAPKGTVKGEPLPQFTRWSAEPVIKERKEEPEKKPEDEVLPEEDLNPTLDPVNNTTNPKTDKTKDKTKKPDKSKTADKSKEKPKPTEPKPEKPKDKTPKEEKPKDTDPGDSGDKQEIPTQPPEIGW